MAIRRWKRWLAWAALSLVVLVMAEAGWQLWDPRILGYRVDAQGVHLMVGGYAFACNPQRSVWVFNGRAWEPRVQPAVAPGDVLDGEAAPFEQCAMGPCMPISQVSWLPRRVMQEAPGRFRHEPLQGTLRLTAVIARNSGCGGMTRTVTLEGSGQQWEFL